ncbi:hypothetical protein EV421DRAFT_1743585 [Armillaria borealis]|uniref:GOLD domain-containing protein n=1 Tax=Armillaria borealis TaxID=47425 RepID=A0AA39IW93_9AGAR|nr:hypothetical protein EV421DRAFT_1743585 [Armillaria borealis]
MLLLIVLSCINFPTSRGFRFDDYTGSVTARIPITLSWYCDAVNGDNIDFSLVMIQAQGSFQQPSFSATDGTHPDRMVDISFPVLGQYEIETKADEFTVATSRTFNVAASSSGSNMVPSSWIREFIGLFCDRLPESRPAPLRNHYRTQQMIHSA